MSDQQQMKIASAKAALAFIEDDMIVGVGTGSTVDVFIECLATIKHRIAGVVASSVRTQDKLKTHGFVVYELNTVEGVDLYVDGADEVDAHLRMIKGGGGAHTREKILAQVAKLFVCIADETKRVSLLGENCPVPVEVIPMARSYVGREMLKLGAHPVYREDFLTDNGNRILDVYGLDLSEPARMENALNLITGVVENGLFIHRRADKLVLAGKTGVNVYDAD